MGIIHACTHIHTGRIEPVYKDQLRDQFKVASVDRWSLNEEKICKDLPMQTERIVECGLCEQVVSDRDTLASS